MARHNPVLTLSFEAGEDLSSYQFHAVVLDDNDTVVLMDAADEVPIGVLQNAPESGETAEVAVLGVAKTKANGALTVGSPVKAEFVSVTDCGKADAADTDGDICIGHVVFAAGAEDDIASVLLTGPHYMSVPASG
ncbi:MAG: capsid cement protein [Desulfobacterales bacterium]